MARPQKVRTSYLSKSPARVAQVPLQPAADTWRRVETVKAGWSELERRQRALIGQLKRNQLIEICFGKGALLDRRQPARQVAMDW